jgi:hypothetical protein
VSYLEAIDLVRAEIAHELALVDNRKPIAEAVQLVQVVRDEEDGGARVP